MVKLCDLCCWILQALVLVFHKKHGIFTKGQNRFGHYWSPHIFIFKLFSIQGFQKLRCILEMTLQKIMKQSANVASLADPGGICWSSQCWCWCSRSSPVGTPDGYYPGAWNSGAISRSKLSWHKVCVCVCVAKQGHPWPWSSGGHWVQAAGLRPRRRCWSWWEWWRHHTATKEGD